MTRARRHSGIFRNTVLSSLYVFACVIFLAACVLPQAQSNSGLPFYELNENGEKQVKLGQEEYDIDGSDIKVPFQSPEVCEAQLSRECFFRSEFLGDVPNPPPKAC